MRGLNEKCGIFGILSPSRANVALAAYYGLFALQHRGQESCGIAVNNGGIFHAHKDIGLVSEVFHRERIESLGRGNMAVGHVRYSTTGINSRENCQPILVTHIKGHMALAHNGNLVNSAALREELELRGSIFHTTSDTEVISYIITDERIKSPTIVDAVYSAMDRLEGAYSLIVMTSENLIAVRDKHGFRPLCLGKTGDGSYVAASESCALDAVGANFIRDVFPGEIVVFDKGGMRSIAGHCGKVGKSLCVFEYIYFARPDSVIDGVSIHEARLRAGSYLAVDHPVRADVVVGVPDSGIDAAIGYARQSGIPYGIGFIKNKYIGRTFISPDQSSREDLVRIKLNPVAETVRGKRVVLVDDSIVRGTTCRRIVKLLRDAGASEVHMRVSAPPFLNPCYYGTDIDSRDKLIACSHSTEEIAKIIGVDSLGYLGLDRVSMLAPENRGGYCTACFSGSYPTEVPDKGSQNAIL
jgi:amidophosphoribosyltransferase